VPWVDEEEAISQEGRRRFWGNGDGSKGQEKIEV
jgi:hypothetical protein